MRDLLVETARRVFANQKMLPGAGDEVDPGTCSSIWAALSEAGIAQALHPSMAGEISLADAGALLRPAAFYAAPVPLAETLLSQWLLSATGCTVPETPLTIVPGLAPIHDTSKGRYIAGDLSRIPWVRQCPQVVVPINIENGFAFALLNVADCQVEEGRNLAGERRDRITAIAPISEVWIPQNIEFDKIVAIGAAFRSIQIAGALDRVLELTLQYVQDRVQFGKPLAKQQAVQQLCAVLAGHCAAAAAAADLAIDALDDDIDHHRIAAAKIRCGEAAGFGAAIAHQLHGAMGVTREHALHRFTRRLWSWRDEYGSEAHWSAWLGRELIERGADALWPAITKAA